MIRPKDKTPFIEMNKEAKARVVNALALTLFFVAVFFMLLSTTIQATTSGSSDDANLTIWTNGTASSENRTVGAGLSGKTLGDYNFYFIANLTNSTGAPLNLTVGNGNCTIYFNETGTLGASNQMSENSDLWVLNRTFNYKGNLSFLVNCTSDYGNVTNLIDYFYILNTPPYLSTISSISFSNVEDNYSANNFSQYVREDDVNDVLAYSIVNITSNKHAETTASYYQDWIWLNSSNGFIYVNATNDTEAADYAITLQVLDNGNDGQDIGGLIKTVSVNVASENDPPYFVNLGENRTLNKSFFELILSAADEENDINYTFNVSFLNCVHTSINPPTGPDNCTLFNLTYYNGTATNISFTPQDNQRGEYEINFSVVDFRNAKHSEVVNWTFTWNDPPYFVYVCDNERNATEDSEFTCYINASDIDEVNNLTFSANYSWFTFNSTATNQITIPESGTENFSAFVNFTPTDSAVGNWSVNITITDTGDATTASLHNSTVFYFFVDNINDSVSIVNITDQLVWTSSTSEEIPVNATDGDLLIPDDGVYDETLTFIINNSNIAVSGYTEVAGTNRAEATLSFNPNNLGVGNHTVNVTAFDLNNNSVDSDIFTIEVRGNNAPQWDATTETDHLLTEDVPFYLNLSENVTDIDSGETLTFNYLINNLGDGGFPGFSNTSAGIINFTPNDYDVGYHNVTITVTDSKASDSLEFNFTVQNVLDNPLIPSGTTGLDVNTPNATVDASHNITAQEDNYTKVLLGVRDDDYRIEQVDFYNEDITVNLTIKGPNTTLFSFGAGSLTSFPGNNETRFTATFTPRKADVGNYNISINVTDASGLSDFIYFNLTVLESMHIPNMTEIGNQAVSVLNENLYLDINVTDLEDGNDTTPGNFTFVLTNLTTGGNFLTINSSTGVIDFTFSASHAGLWEYTVTVNDTDGMNDSETFNITVYDYPVILLPSPGFEFNFKENVSSQLNFTVNHTIQDTLNYTLIINGVIRNSTIGYGNATEFLWNFTANFTDETTCLGTINITLNVSNSKLSNSTSWNLTINHTNHPLSFYNTILDQGPSGSPIPLTLSDYFTDIDAADYCINQSIGFTYLMVNGSDTGGTISIAIVNWTDGITPQINFSATSDARANYSVTAIEYNVSNPSQALRDATSNNFSVQITATSTPQDTSTSSCFPAGTKILMANGDQKNIEDVRLGDYVASYNENKKLKTVGNVLDLESPIREHMCKITFEDGSKLELTNEHPLYTKNGWKSINPEETKKENDLLAVTKLKKGEMVLTSDSAYKTIANMVCWNEEVQTYNLKTITPYNNFYADSFLAHNKGGTSTSIRIISLKIIVPEPVSAKQKDRLVIPLGIVNDGTINLYGILLGATIAKDGLLRNDLLASFDTSSFDALEVGQRENVTLIVDIDTSATGLFEVTINGTVKNPQYSDWAKFYIEIEEDKYVLERIIFTEEFIIGNPECAEFVDLIGEAKALFAQGRSEEALRKSEESLEACKRAISQPPRPRIYERLGDRFLGYTAIASLIALGLGFSYYYYKKIKLKHQLRGY
ncbi:MAG: hypothetical protein ABIH92_05730 [Nanoarchaeota archaeon]